MTTTRNLAPTMSTNMRPRSSATFHEFGNASRASLPFSPPSSVRTSLIRHSRHNARHLRSITANATKAQAGKKSKSSSKTSLPPLPLPSTASAQQTISHAFTISGVGLHTGETTVLTVKPACAGEGRYFVRVPEGTNAGKYSLPKPQFVRREQLDVNYGAEDGLDAEDRAQLFLQYMSEKSESSDAEGDVHEEFGEYLQRNVDDLLQDDFIFGSIDKAQEEATPRGGDEEVVQADIGLAEVYGETTTLLRSSTGNSYVMSPEALLSALEACGVDNARIEVEGGSEVPVADGSALTWVLEVQKAGVRACDGGEVIGTRSVSQVVTVTGGASRPGAFVSFYPSIAGDAAEESAGADGQTTIITAGVDYHGSSEAIGRQWVTWKTSDASLEDEFANHYRWTLAPARPVFPSYASVEELFADGLIQAGPDGCCVIAEGDSWYDPNLVRFPLDEAARHAAQRLIGVLSMCAVPGGRGLPPGHIVAYDATPAMMIDFALELRNAM